MNHNDTSLQTHRPNSPSPAASASEERSPDRSSDSLEKRFNDLVTGFSEFLSLVRLIHEG